MTIRTSTIRMPFATYLTTPGLATATRHDFAAITLPIPMTGSRAFRSVRVILTYRTEAAMTVTTTLVGIKLGAVAFTDQSIAQTITNSGEDQDRIVESDVTAYFTANFGAATTQTAQVGFSFVAASGTITNITAVLVITFDWDDAHASATTRVKTIPILLDNPATLTAVLTTVGGANQIPILDTVLGESTKVFSSKWFEIDGNVCSAAVTDGFLQAALDAEGAVTIYNEDQTNSSSCHTHTIWVRNDMTSSATHDLKLASTVTARYPHLRCVLWVTYTYDHANSTRITNHARLPLSFDGMVSGDAARANRSRRVLSIQEPGTITTINAGVTLDWVNTPATTRELVLKVGVQTIRTFVDVAPTLICGYCSLGHRFDAGATDGAGLTFVRGENTIDVDLYQETTADTDTTTLVGFASGFVDVVYTSDKHASGDGVHMRVVEMSLLDFQRYAALTAYRLTTAVDVAVVPTTTNYSRQGTAIVVSSMQRGSPMAASVCMERKSAEAGPSWEDVGRGIAFPLAAAENFSMVFVAGDDRTLQRWPSDPGVGRSIVSSTARRWQLANLLSPYGASMNVVTTYHSIKKTIAGTITGYTGTGAGITVDVSRVDTGEKIAVAVSAAGGGWTADVYDDTLSLKAEAQQDQTHTGRSYNAVVP